MKRTIITLGLVGLMSSCGIQFGNYERWKQVNKPSMCQEEVTQDDYYATINCENCDEID